MEKQSVCSNCGRKYGGGLKKCPECGKMTPPDIKKIAAVAVSVVVVTSAGMGFVFGIDGGSDITQRPDSAVSGNYPSDYTHNSWTGSYGDDGYSSYLPDDYDSISNIGVWNIPGPGPFGNYYLGIKAVRSDITFYYSFNKHVFTLEEALSSDDIREREKFS